MSYNYRYNYHIDENDVEGRIRLAAQFDGHGRIVMTTGSAILRVHVPECSTLPGTLRYLARKAGMFWILTGPEAKVFLEHIEPYVQETKECIRYALCKYDKIKAADVAYVKMRVNVRENMPRCHC